MKTSKPSWPDYLPAPKDDVFALGVIALNYGFLENILECVFAEVARLNRV
jgi:hypothetical protein